RLVRLKKAQARQQPGGLACEACSFDFAAVYGELGEGFAECHHRLPFSQLKATTYTRLEDLAIVCANCHRILHRRRGWDLRVEDLRAHLQKRDHAAWPGGLNRLPQKG